MTKRRPRCGGRVNRRRDGRHAIDHAMNGFLDKRWFLLPPSKPAPCLRDDIEQSIPQRFENIVRKHGDRLAVRTRTRELTYFELDPTANQIANAILDDRGAAQEPVVLLLENDAFVIASMLGVLKARKFYVPLDPSHPFSRLEFMLDDSASPLIVTNDATVLWLNSSRVESFRSSISIAFTASARARRHSKSLRIVLPTFFTHRGRPENPKASFKITATYCT